VHHRVEIAGDKDEIGDIVADERKPFMSGQMGQVLSITGDEIIHPDDLVALGDQAVAEVGTQKPRRSCHKYSHD
jgi:hypothetical protein